MSTINAQTIINAVMQAHAVAPLNKDTGFFDKIKFQTSAPPSAIYSAACNTCTHGAMSPTPLSSKQSTRCTQTPQTGPRCKTGASLPGFFHGSIMTLKPGVCAS